MAIELIRAQGRTLGPRHRAATAVVNVDRLIAFGNRSSSSSGRNRSNGENIMSPSGGDFDGTFDMLLTLDLAKIKVLFVVSRKNRQLSTPLQWML